jgi:hypothetical protein
MTIVEEIGIGDLPHPEEIEIAIEILKRKVVEGREIEMGILAKKARIKLILTKI